MAIIHLKDGKNTLSLFKDVTIWLGEDLGPRKDVHCGDGEGAIS